VSRPNYHAGGFFFANPEAVWLVQPVCKASNLLGLALYNSLGFFVHISTYLIRILVFNGN